MGNDIVDLAAPGAIGKARDARFVKRVLTGEEQRALSNSENPDALLWAFWAAKEAAYKAISKQISGISSAPGRYSVMLNNGNLSVRSGHVDGRVKTPEGLVCIRIYIHEGHVHCIATTAGHHGIDKIVWAVKAISPGEKTAYSHEFESSSVRKLATEQIALHTGRDGSDIRILRENRPRGFGPPIVYYKGKKADLDISLSHDGRFAACAFAPIL